ncbi:MAG: phosphatidate cytidylyltransferase [Deltaproteobacteria bacterium]|nr:phosphatidate cytidylyltransferase [Deltaproteobacteria bacterium]
MEANLRARLLTALVGVPLLILLVARSSTAVFSTVIFFVTVLALGEYFRMVFPNGLRDQLLGVGFGAALSLSLLYGGAETVQLSTALVLLLYFSLYIWLSGSLEDKLRRLAWLMLGGFYLGYLLPHLALLFRLPEGRHWVLFVLIVIMSGDSVAYFAGKRFGKKRLAPEISPGKTVEGALGYFAGSVIAGLIGAKYLFVGISAHTICALALVLATLGQVGDLFESWIKRVFSVKDSGQLLPGHGGLLDRLDSLIFPAVFTTAYLRVFYP